MPMATRLRVGRSSGSSRSGLTSGPSESATRSGSSPSATSSSRSRRRSRPTTSSTSSRGVASSRVSTRRRSTRRCRRRCGSWWPGRSSRRPSACCARPHPRLPRAGRHARGRERPDRGPRDDAPLLRRPAGARLRLRRLQLRHPAQSRRPRGDPRGRREPAPPGPAPAAGGPPSRLARRRRRPATPRHDGRGGPPHAPLRRDRSAWRGTSSATSGAISRPVRTSPGRSCSERPRWSSGDSSASWRIASGPPGSGRGTSSCPARRSRSTRTSCSTAAEPSAT